jgi:two-component system chemotaxis response regulator CheY
MKALVVDDHLVTRMVLHGVLCDHAEVLCCVDGNEAVLACKKALDDGDPYDLICMDVFMPVMGGIEALKLIRGEEELRDRLRPRAAKVVVITAADDIATISEAFQGLSDAYVVKPIDAGEFLDIVRCWFPIGESAG